MRTIFFISLQIEVEEPKNIMKTVQTHLNKTFIYFICCVSAMGGLLFGYDWVVIGGAKPFYESFFGIGGDPTM